MNKKKDPDDFKSALKNFKSADFDGHTDFKSFSAEQKLRWLSNAAHFRFLTGKNQIIKSKAVDKSNHA